MASEHEIRTINDIYRVVDESNKEVFLADFTAWLDIAVETKKLDPDRRIIDMDRFGWNDDGKPGTLRSINFEVKEDEP